MKNAQTSRRTESSRYGQQVSLVLPTDFQMKKSLRTPPPCLAAHLQHMHEIATASLCFICPGLRRKLYQCTP